MFSNQWLSQCCYCISNPVKPLKIIIIKKDCHSVWCRWHQQIAHFTFKPFTKFINASDTDWSDLCNMHKNTQHICPLLHLCIFSITSITNILLPPPLFLRLSLLFISHLPLYLGLSLFLKISSSHRGAGRSFSLNELERRQHTHSRKTTPLLISLSEDTQTWHKCSTELQEPHTHKLFSKA